VTDDAYNAAGWAIDRIGIAELAFADDVERGAGGWDGEGFVRVTNFMPQRYSVQFLVYDSSGGLTIDGGAGEPLGGEWSVDSFGSEVEQVVMIVSGLTPVTTEWFYYEYTAALQ
jgi:hypothetical protein